jgi:hypothetical protein
MARTLNEPPLEPGCSSQGVGPCSDEFDGV